MDRTYLRGGLNTFKLRQLGQSPWLDSLSRDLIRSGELSRLIAEESLTGITSNPTIFDKAIRGSAIYEEQVRKLAAEGRSAFEIYEELAIADVREACDLLSGVYRSTWGGDGFVSLEPPAQYAYDLGKTLVEVRRLFSLVGRENVMIKLPGTSQGVAALPQFIAEGININVTLIFSPTNYQEVARAYLQGLEQRVRSSEEPGRVASVASVFVSRVDTAVDRELGALLSREAHPGLDALQGQAAIANARIIFHRYQEIFSGEQFRALERRGARRQRLLWGSTSTKNPAYSDVKYVDELIGPDTVNTMPPETWQAFQSHGTTRLTVEEGLEEARKVVARLASWGIALEQVCSTLQREGVEAFARSLDTLLAALEEKRKAALGA